QGFARHWLHNGFVQVDNEKMSKSLHNFFTIRDVLKEYRPEEVRFFLLGAHYRKPINYSQEELEQARACVKRLYTALQAAPLEVEAVAGEHTTRFVAAMDDDFNTPGGIAVFFELARDINRAQDQGDTQAAIRLAAELRALGGRLGLLQDDPEQYLKSAGGSAQGPDDATIDGWVAERNAARAGGDYARADEIRDQLAAAGITVLDGAQGTAWRRD
ncbi:MAG: DALR domain-containing protein, partial [Gammaproteobacteria bacterium]